MGHTGPVCPSKKDRSSLCFRCGVEGHKAAECVATMRCAVCVDAGLPSGHIMGSNNCRPPSVKGGNGPQPQTNLNHCAGAQDLLLQSIAEWKIDLAVACEPYFVPSHAHWVGDTDDLVVVVSANNADPSLSAVERGPGYAVARWGEYTIVGVYFSPNRPLAEFETFLDSVSEAVRRHNEGRTLVLGDFNAKSQAWGSPATDARGRSVQVWAVHQGLSLLNRGTTYTCVREEGGSIVDLSFATPLVADRVTGWKVWDWVETLSDHNYIRFKISSPAVVTMTPSSVANCFPRWCLSRVDQELLREAAIVQRWSSLTFESDASGPRMAPQQVCVLVVRRNSEPPYRQSPSTKSLCPVS
ncbi:uncharacterized protein LOC128198872 [Bicyclus anynana]|uniref:Uncharacterized protein LOC128198872 n=1 Tax=Bicyclus anynana TaxID=110368 RepID=A0ABM3LT92_BICAN|nr:uncharacterized protein LOC128198872 [Bicyclus anynana]